MTDAEAARTLSELFISSDEGIDIIVHNAGVTRDRTFLKMTTEQWSTALDVNLRAVMALTWK